VTNWRSAVISGSFLVLGGTALIAWAEQWVPSGITALLVGTVPLWFVLLEWMRQHGRRPPLRTIAGIILGFTGFAVLVGPDLAREGVGAALPAAVILLSTLLWALGSLYTRGASLPSSRVLGMGMEMLAGGVTCLVVGLLIGEARSFDLTAVSGTSLLALTYLVVFGSLIAFTCYLWLHDVSTPTRVSTHIYVNPIVALFLGWAIAGEPVTAQALVATVIILGAVGLMGAKE
jgi:drug/metabolite transporter (DMT)-like permease